MTLTSAPDRRRPTDPDLHTAVQEELGRSAGIDERTIGVSVDRGVVHLDGEVEDATQDAAVRKAVLRVSGILGIVDRLRCAPRAGRDDA